MDDKIWYKDISVLWKKPTELFPFSTVKTDEERINSIVRSVVLVLIGSFIISREIFIRLLIVSIGFLILTVLYYNSLNKTNEITVIAPEDYVNPLRSPINVVTPHENRKEKYNLLNVSTRRKVMHNAGKNNVENILNDIHGTMGTYNMVEPDKDYKYFNYKLHYDATKGSILKNNKSGDAIYGGRKHETHIKYLKNIYNQIKPSKL